MEDTITYIDRTPFTKRASDFSKIAAMGRWEILLKMGGARNGKVSFVIGGWEIFKVSLAFPGYEYNIH